MKLRITMVEQLLGTAPNDDKLYESFILSKAPADVETSDEIESLPELIAKGIMVFHRNSQGELCIMDWQIKGFLKEIGDNIRQRNKGGPDAGRWSAWKVHVSKNVHVFPRFISSGKTVADGFCDRPLRSMTRQGEITALVRSEIFVAGTQFDLEIVNRAPRLISDRQIHECLDEGQYYGLGQWRNSGNGRFTYEIIAMD